MTGTTRGLSLMTPRKQTGVSTASAQSVCGEFVSKADSWEFQVGSWNYQILGTVVGLISTYTGD